MRCPLGAGLGLVLQADLSLAVWAFRPWSSKLLAWVVASVMRLVVAGSLRCSSNGSGRFGARPAEPREQLVGGVRLVPGVGQDLHDIMYRWGVPEPGAGTRSGGWLGQGGLGFLFLGAGGFRRVLVPRMPGRDPAHSGAPPVGRPFLHGPLRPFDHLSDDARVDATGGVQDRFCLHPRQHMIVETLLSSDQNGGFLRGDLNLHVPIISETVQEIHEKHGSFHVSHIKERP